MKKEIYMDKDYWYREIKGFIPTQSVISEKLKKLSEEAKQNAKLDKEQQKLIEELAKIQQDAIEKNNETDTTQDNEISSIKDSVEKNYLEDVAQGELISQNASSITSIKEDIEELREDVDGLLGDMEDTKENISALTDATISINDTITELKGYDEEVKKAIWGIIYRRDHEIFPAIEQNTEDIEMLKNQISGDTEMIEEMYETVSGYTEKIDGLELVKEDEAGLVYSLMLGNENRGTINIPKDNFLSHVSFDPETDILSFDWENSGHTEVPLSALVDVYNGSEAIAVSEGNIISLKVSNSTEKYLKIASDGIMVEGIDSAITSETERAEKVEKAISDALTTEKNERIDNEFIINDKIDTLSGKVSTLSGEVATVKEDLKKNAEEDAKLKNTVVELADDVNTISGQVENLLSLKEKVEKNEQDIAILDGKLSDEINRATNAETTIKGLVKSNSEAIEGLKSDLGKISDEITGLKAKDSVLEGNINKLSGVTDTLNEGLTALSSKVDNIHIPTAVSELTNDVPYLVAEDVKDFATKNEVEEVKKLIPSSEEFATKDMLAEGLLAVEQDLANYAQTSWVEENYSTTLSIEEKYASKQWVEDKKYMTQDEFDKVGIAIMKQDIADLQDNDRKQDDRLLALESKVEDLLTRVGSMEIQVQDLLNKSADYESRISALERKMQ